MVIETHPADAFPTHIPSRSDFAWDVHLKETTEVK